MLVYKGPTKNNFQDKKKILWAYLDANSFYIMAVDMKENYFNVNTKSDAKVVQCSALIRIALHCKEACNCIV